MYEVVPIDDVLRLGRENPRYLVTTPGLFGDFLQVVAGRYGGGEMMEHGALMAGMNYLLAEQDMRYVGQVPGNDDDYLVFWVDR